MLAPPPPANKPHPLTPLTQFLKGAHGGGKSPPRIKKKIYISKMQLLCYTWPLGAPRVGRGYPTCGWNKHTDSSRRR